MNINKTGLPLAIHRKKSVSFRDKSLLQIFQVAMQTLSSLMSGSYGQIAADQDAKLREQCLKLTLACLSYDFFGTSSDETTEDVGTVQVPTNWRPLIEDQSTMATLLQAYNTSAAPRSAQAMECLSQLASVRRSLFPNQETRQAFLHRILTAVVTVLRGQQRLGEEQNFHEFCRLLSRVKSNFQLGEMIKCGDVYQELIQLVAVFTVQSLQVLFTFAAREPWLFLSRAQTQKITRDTDTTAMRKIDCLCLWYIFWDIKAGYGVTFVTRIGSAATKRDCE